MNRELCKDEKILHTKSVNITKDDDINGLMTDLIDTFIVNRKSLAISAPQIGINKKMIVVLLEEGFVALINPIVLKKSGPKCIDTESCLSCNRDVWKERADSITILTYVNNLKKTKKLTYVGIWARIIQHEIDHLNGILITD